MSRLYKCCDPHQRAAGLRREVRAEHEELSFLLWPFLKDVLDNRQRREGVGPSGVESQMRDDLRRFKRISEIGEVPSINGQPRGEPIEGAVFFSALLRVWLGDKPADASLKKAMLGG